MTTDSPIPEVQLRNYIIEYPNSLIEQGGVWLKNDYGIDYKLNSRNLRCDEFKRDHNGEHIIFAGCSNTFGVGTEYEDTWAYQVYNEISKVKDVSGYYNLGLNAGTAMESILQIFAYIKEFSVPDTIFLFLPELERDDAFFFYPHEHTDEFVVRLYGILDLFCKLSGTKLITSSWILNYPGMWDRLRQDTVVYGNFPEKLERSRLRNEEHMFDRFSSTFKSFKSLDNDRFVKDVYMYSLDHKNDPNLYVAKDPGRHFGSAIHHAWKTQFLERYLNEKTN